MIVHIAPYEASYQAIEERLKEMGKSSEVKSVIQKAINETAKETKERLYKETRSDYTIKASNFKKSDVKKTSATKSRLEATIQVTGRMLGVKAYKTRKNGKRKGAQAKVLASSAMKELTLESGGKTYKAFNARMRSGHEGIFRRIPGRRNKKGKEKIGEIMSIAKAQAAGKTYERHEMYAELQEEVGYQLLKHMNAVIGG